MALSKEEKLAAIRRVDSGEKVKAVARDCQIAESTLRSWLTNRGRATRMQISEQTKRLAIERARAGIETKCAIARDIGVPESTLRSWITKSTLQQPPVFKRAETRKQITIEGNICEIQTDPPLICETETAPPLVLSRVMLDEVLRPWLTSVITKTAQKAENEGRSSVTPNDVLFAIYATPLKLSEGFEFSFAEVDNN